MQGDLEDGTDIGDGDVIDPGLIDTGDESSGDQTDDAGDGGGGPKGKEFWYKGPDGSKVPVKVNEDGSFDLPAPQGKGDGSISREEFQRQLDVQRENILREIKAGRGGEEKPGAGDEPVIEENPHNWETTEAAQKWVQHEVQQLGTEVSAGFDKMFRAYQEMADIIADISSGGEKQRLHSDFEKNFGVAVEAAGVPKPTTAQAKEYLDDLREIVMTHPKLKANILIRDKKTGQVDEAATDRARREGFTEEQLVQRFYRHYQAATQQGATGVNGRVVKTAKTVLPSPHGAGSGAGLPPTAGASGKKPIYDEAARALPPSISVLRRAKERQTLRG